MKQIIFVFECDIYILKCSVTYLSYRPAVVSVCIHRESILKGSENAFVYIFCSIFYSGHVKLSLTISKLPLLHKFLLFPCPDMCVFALILNGSVASERFT